VVLAEAGRRGKPKSRVGGMVEGIFLTPRFPSLFTPPLTDDSHKIYYVTFIGDVSLPIPNHKGYGE